MDCGGHNIMFSLNNHTKEETNNNNTLWYSSWQPTTNVITTSCNTSTLQMGEGYGLAAHVQADNHLTCLHLGKRHYFEDATGNRHVCGGANDKRGRGCHGKTAPFAVVPRCQVEGCHVALFNAKEYHRRHRVCDMHSKAPKVVVLGLDQRFCQQCSRFHVVSEFDDSKRSCRRRLAGHNERRRKSSHLSVTRNSKQGCALSLLSSGSSDHNWLSHADLSTRCSAALRELIAENRAALMSRQLVSDRDWHVAMPHHAAVEQDFEQLQPESNYFPQQMFPQTQ